MEQAGNIPPSDEHRLSPVIDIPDFDIFEKVIEKHIEGMKEATSEAMKKLTEELIVTGEASMECIDPIIPPEPVTERLTVEEFFRRYPATPPMDAVDSVKSMPFGSEEASKLMTKTFESIPPQSKTREVKEIKIEPMASKKDDFDLPEFL